MARKPPKSRPRVRPAAGFRFESLEPRHMMSGTPPTLSVSDATAIEGDESLRFIDRFVAASSGGLSTARSLILDGNGDGVEDLYVASAATDEILRYDGQSGAFLGAFVSAGAGGLDNPTDLAFHPNGDLYVGSLGNGQILRYDGVTGDFLNVVASGMNNPLGLTFDDDGSLYITNQFENEILRYDDASGLQMFVSAGSGGLNRPRHAVFGPDSNGDGRRDLYVASQGSGQVLRYDALTGAPLGVFVTMTTGPSWLEFGSDGLLYTTHRPDPTMLETNITRFDALTGAYVDTLPLGRDGWSFYVGDDSLVYNSTNAGEEGHFVARFGQASQAVFTVSLSAASDVPVTVNYTTAAGSAAAGADFTPITGTVVFQPGETSRTVLVQTLDDLLDDPSETFSLVLFNAVAGAIADGVGVATIADNDPAPTKFYVVDDGSANRTYEYGSTGSSIEDYALNSGNSAPRGVASTVAGDKVWVVDANRKVYVYNTSGGLLGSWTAGTMTSAAKPEDITVHGNDVWIVDAQSDKVFRYAGAASRTSGSHNAASSFNLNGSNRDPKGLVTDGASLWVVNDGSTDKVFKYTLAGALVGSWTISAANSKPTGITIDPANVSDVWIVDSGTDRVYRYVAAAGRTSGSQNAAANFALTSGNTNPQGIADPPPRGTAVDAKFVRAESSRDVAAPLSVERPGADRHVARRARDRFFDALSMASVAATRALARGNPTWLESKPSDSIERHGDAESGSVDEAFKPSWAGERLIPALGDLGTWRYE